MNWLSDNLVVTLAEIQRSSVQVRECSRRSTITALLFMTMKVKASAAPRHRPRSFHKVNVAILVLQYLFFQSHFFQRTLNKHDSLICYMSKKLQKLLGELWVTIFLYLELV